MFLPVSFFVFVLNGTELYLGKTAQGILQCSVVVPGEVGILLIYAPNIFLSVPAKDERPVL